MQYQICVSGAASGETVQLSHELAFRVGKAITGSGHIITTGATIGLPHYAAMGAVSATGERGLSVGFSPASSLREHVMVYKLPTKEFDYINFTGMAYVGRDVHLVRTSDAVITVGGRMGSLHELSTALESRKVCAVLLGSGGLANFVPELLENIETPGARTIIYESDPELLVQRVIEALDAKYADFMYDTNDCHVRTRRAGRG